MKMSKPILFLAFSVFVIVLYVFTKPPTLINKQNEKKTVLTTFTVLADMARNVAGDNVTVESLTKVGTEIHGYEPTPQDLIRAQKASLILDNGLGLEKWSEKLYNSIPRVPHTTLSDGVIPISIGEGPYLNKPNPHAWMSPSNALIYVENIKNSLIELDPINKNSYEKNAENYKVRIKNLDARLKTAVEELPSNKRYLASCEGAFTYLIRDYGLKELYLWPINADAQGTPQQIKKVVETVKKNKISVVFCESTVNDKAMRQVANETDSLYGGAFYVDSLSDSFGPTSSYEKLLEYNIDILIKGLAK